MIKKNDFEKFVKLLIKLEKLYKDKIPKDLYILYFEILKEYNFEQIDAGIMALVKTKKYKSFPLPAEIIEAIDGGNIEDIAEEQFGAIMMAMATDKINVYEGAQFDDLLIHKTIKAMGGWVRFCQTPNDQMQWKKKEFVKLYGIYKKRLEYTELPLMLEGIHSQINYKKGYVIDMPSAKIKTRHPISQKHIPGIDAKEQLNKLRISDNEPSASSVKNILGVEDKSISAKE